MRDRKAHAHVSRDDLLTLEHRVDVGRIYAASVDQELSGLADGFFLGSCLLVEQDAFFGEYVRFCDLFYRIFCFGSSGHHCVTCGDLHEQVVQSGIREEVADLNDLSGRAGLLGAVCQDGLYDSDIAVSRDVVDGSVLDNDVRTERFDSVAELGRAHSGGAHAGVTREDDLLDISNVADLACADGHALGLCLLGGQVCLRVFQAGALVSEADDRGSDQEGNGCRDQDTCQNQNDLIPGSYGHESDDGTG